MKILGIIKSTEPPISPNVLWLDKKTLKTITSSGWEPILSESIEGITGPTSSVINNFVTFGDEKGTTVKDSGIGLNDLVGKFDPNSVKYGEIFNSYYTGNNKDANGLGNNVASGLRSHAEGGKTQAIGQYSHAEGMQTIVSGMESHAEGYSTLASGDYGAHAEGNSTVAAGDCSHAEGRNTEAVNYAEHAEGIYNKSNRLGSGGYTIHSVGIGQSSSRKNAHEITNTGNHYIYGIGGYDGTNPSKAKTLQEVVGDCFQNAGINVMNNDEGIELIFTAQEYENTFYIPIATHSDPGLVKGEEKLCIENSLQALNSNYSNFTALDTSADLAAVITKCNQILACLQQMSTV